MLFKRNQKNKIDQPVVEDLRRAPGRAGLRGVDSRAFIERPALFINFHKTL
jgi:hypothetical protein